jgi:hypothetical protein
MNNPMQNKLPMHQSPRCGAKTRKGTPCQSPAMPNGRCRMHGGTASRKWSAYFRPVIAFAFMPSCGNVHSALLVSPMPEFVSVVTQHLTLSLELLEARSRYPAGLHRRKQLNSPLQTSNLLSHEA